MSGRAANSQAGPCLHLELLEERIAPTGNVIVTTSGGNLTLTGDADANEFMIESSGPSEFRITPGPGTTLNDDASDMTVQNITGMKMRYTYLEQNRIGDHICYYSDLRKMRAHYPNWQLKKPLVTVFEEIVSGWTGRSQLASAPCAS